MCSFTVQDFTQHHTLPTAFPDRRTYGLTKISAVCQWRIDGDKRALAIVQKLYESKQRIIGEHCLHLAIFYGGRHTVLPCIHSRYTRESNLFIGNAHHQVHAHAWNLQLIALIAHEGNVRNHQQDKKNLHLKRWKKCTRLLLTKLPRGSYLLLSYLSRLISVNSG